MNRGPVVLDALVLRGEPTGVGRSVQELLRAMAAKDHGLDFVVLSAAPRMLDFLREVPRWRVLECPAAGGGALRKALFTQFQIPRLCDRLGARLLHSLQFVGPVRAGRPHVVTVHDLLWQRYPETIEQPRLAYYRTVVPRVLARATRILANSRATAEGLAQDRPELAGRIEAIPFGTPSWVWGAPDGDSGYAAAAPRGRRKPYFLFVGTLEPRKNLEGLLRAYRIFLDDARAGGVPESRIPVLRVAGARGWKDSPLRRELAAWEGSGRVEMLGYRSGSDLLGLYAQARAVLFPSLHEGFGFPILEAMALGTAVMTSDRDAMAEVAGNCALLVDPTNPRNMAQALEQLARDDDLVARLVSRGSARAREMTWAETAEQTCAVYHSILDDK